MSFAQEFEGVERKALVENTAQDVFNILKDLENQASLHASRWIWELLQNARDAASPKSPLHIVVRLTANEVRFLHDGMPFTSSQIAHLIHHGSTKYQEEGQVGRFGTGFLSTHIISHIPRISGRLDDGRRFTFVLDRRGDSPTDLTNSMEKSSQDFVDSVSSGKYDQTDDSTCYVYPIDDSKVSAIAHQGVASLDTYAPYVLAFNHQIESIEVVREANRRLYTRKPAQRLSGNVRAAPISLNDEDIPSFVVATVTDESVTVALLARRVCHTTTGFEQSSNGLTIDGDGTGSGSAGVDAHEIQFGLNVPRFFMAFPLFGTEKLGFPGVANSSEFRPKKDRDGLYLGSEPADYNIKNKSLLQQACPLFVILLRECATSGWRGIELLCENSPGRELKGVDENWLQSLIKASLVEPLRKERVLRTCGNELIAASNAWIPCDACERSRKVLWNLAFVLAECGGKLVKRSLGGSWQRNLLGWAAVLGISPEGMDESLTLEKCAHKLAGFGSLKKLGEAFRCRCDPIKWCNRLFGLLIQAGRSSSFDTLSLLPDQNGTFKKRKDLHLDSGIAAELKDIGQQLGVPIRSGLLHGEIASPEIHKLLQVRTETEVLADLGRHLRQHAEELPSVPSLRQGNIRLFSWILTNGVLDNLDSFPVVSQGHGTGDEGTHVITLSKDCEPENIPLAPPECWPKKARPFSSLFPLRHVLSSDYYMLGENDAIWKNVAEREQILSRMTDERKGHNDAFWKKLEELGYVRMSPVYMIADQVQDFLPDDTLTDDDIHRSKDPITTTQIAFLNEKNIGLLDSARKSRTKCVLLLRFIGSYLIRDATWRDRIPVQCECEKTHIALRAGWLGTVKEKNKWIYVSKDRSDVLSAESVARLLKDEKEIIGLLADDEGSKFLAAFGVSASDFLMRSATPDEDKRISLSRSSIQMFRALGGDIGLMNEFAEVTAAAAHPETIIEVIRERNEVRRKVERNQKVGKAVEEALEAALGSGHGLKVERDPVGSDYTVERENDFLDDEEREILLRVGRFYIEVKATIGQYVRMTDAQGKKAKGNSACYVLCVVSLANQDEVIDKDSVRGKVKFVTDIGLKIRDLVEAVESLEGSRNGVLGRTGQIEVEMDDQKVKYRIAHTVWETGIDFEEAVRHFGGTTKPR